MIDKNMQDTALDDLFKRRGFNLYGERGFTVNGLVVAEFDYLISFVTSGGIDSFNNFELIVSSISDIDRSLVDEMAKDIPREAEINFTNPEGARRNLENLRYIIFAINDYVLLATRLGLPLNPLL